MEGVGGDGAAEHVEVGGRADTDQLTAGESAAAIKIDVVARREFLLREVEFLQRKDAAAPQRDTQASQPKNGRDSKMSSQPGGNKREIAAAEVISLIDLVNYQEGAVVSRTIVHRPTGTVTLFTFDEGQGLSEHTAPFDALAHVLEGEAEITVSGKPLPTKAGGAVLMPAQQPHALKAVTKFKMLLTMIRV